MPQGGTTIGYNYAPGRRPDSNLLKLNHAFGAEAALPKGWPMSQQALADKLNAYRERALGLWARAAAAAEA